MVLFIIDDITLYVLIGLSIAFFVTVGWYLIDTRIRTPESARTLKEAKSKKRDLILAERPSGNAKFYLAQKDGISPSGYILAGTKKKPLLFVLPHILPRINKPLEQKPTTLPNGGTPTKESKELAESEKEATMRLFNRKTFLPDVGVVLHVGSAQKCVVTNIGALSGLQNENRFKKGSLFAFFAIKIGAVGQFFSQLYKNDWIQAYGETKMQEGIRIGSKRVGEKYQWLFPLIIILALMAFIAVIMFFIKG